MQYWLLTKLRIGIKKGHKWEKHMILWLLDIYFVYVRMNISQYANEKLIDSLFVRSNFLMNFCRKNWNSTTVEEIINLLVDLV